MASVIPTYLKSNPFYRGIRAVALVRQSSHFRRIRQYLRSDSKKISAYLEMSNDRKLHLGCGGNLLPRWLNTDYFPDDPAVPHVDLTAPFPFPDATFDLVFSEHVIEHLPLAGGLNMLREAHRVLRPGGRLRIATPSLPALIAIYIDPESPDHRRYLDWHRDNWLAGVDPITPAVVFNDFLRNWGHLLVYDPSTLIAILDKAGFTDITTHELQRSEDPRLRNLENDTRMPPGLLALHTMTFEAVKG